MFCTCRLGPVNSFWTNTIMKSAFTLFVEEDSPVFIGISFASPSTVNFIKCCHINPLWCIAQTARHCNALHKANINSFCLYAYMSQVITCDRRGVTDAKMWRKKCHSLVFSVTCYQLWHRSLNTWQFYTVIYWRGYFYCKQFSTMTHLYSKVLLHSCSCFYQLLLRCTLFALYCTLFALGLIFSGGSGTVRIQTDPYCTLPTICQDNLFPSRHSKISSAKKRELSDDQCWSKFYR